MVKGITKRVITVRFPDTHAFEQAIFMVREDRTQGVSASDVVHEACVIAERHSGSAPNKNRGRRAKPSIWPPLFYFGLGSAAMGLVWLLVSLFMR